MQGLLLRLAELDADAENAVRVIAYFDELVRHHADAVTVLRAAVVVAKSIGGMAPAATMAASSESRFGWTDMKVTFRSRGT